MGRWDQRHPEQGEENRGRDAGWTADYTRAAYRIWFEEGIEAGSEENLTRSLEDIAPVTGTQ